MLAQVSIPMVPGGYHLRVVIGVAKVIPGAAPGPSRAVRLVVGIADQHHLRAAPYHRVHLMRGMVTGMTMAGDIQPLRRKRDLRVVAGGRRDHSRFNAVFGSPTSCCRRRAA